MKKTFMLLACAGALTMASCSSDNSNTDSTATTTETTTTETSATGNASAAMGGYSDADYNSRADRISQDMASNMKLDDATREKVRTVYYNRSKRLGELHSKYANDTTGMAAEMNRVYSDADTELKTVFTEPEMYATYESNRDMYLEDRYMTTDNTSMASGDDMNAENASGSASMSGTMKAKDGDTKVKIQRDGDLKIKDAADNKTKMDADDGTVKHKPEEGQKVKME
ncbi:hypothetical protein [Solirubrum puertoriconensis]|uniref:Lipoprotein n=1 Tax=Solirubrum puertoriconensis TaxID=1751427 RepID=A0A9X0L670_SOLP1|nr:hypothetical protein [Solirubrum puertoriconensis]KUG09410.1 hypothetical protein ASU33_16915 [Solirubrum puertoriconensis]